MKLRILIIFFIMINIALAQDFHLSQFYTSPVVFNPAETGMMSGGDYRATSSYRDQWRTIGNPYLVQQGNFDMKLYRDKNYNNLFAGGITYLGEKAGAGRMGYWYLGGTLSSSIKVNEKGRLAMGLKGGYGIRTVNVNSFTWDNQWDGTQFNGGILSGEGAFIPNVPFRDFGAGFYYTQKLSEYFNYNAGFALDHLLIPQITYLGKNDRLKMKFTGTAGAEIKVRGSNKTLLPKILMMKQGPNYEFTPGILVKYGLGMESHYTGIYRQSAIYFGGFYRTRDALIVSLQYDHKHYFSFGISYDVNLSKLTPSTYALGGFEVTLQHTGFFMRNKLAVSHE